MPCAALSLSPCAQDIVTRFTYHNTRLNSALQDQAMADSRLAVALSDVQAARASAATDPAVLQALEDAHAQAVVHRDNVYATAALRATTVQTLVDMRAQVDAVSILSPSPCMLFTRAAGPAVHSCAHACCCCCSCAPACCCWPRCSLVRPCMLLLAPCMLLLAPACCCWPLHAAAGPCMLLLLAPCMLLLAPLFTRWHALTRPCPLLPRPCHRSRSMNSCTERTSSCTVQSSSSTTHRTSSTTHRTSSRTSKANCTIPTTRSTS